MASSSFNLSMKVAKLNFFDRKIVKAAKSPRRRALSRAGAIVRGIARRSIKFRKKHSTHSQPGDPPFTHRKSSEFGLKTILFAYEPQRESVVVGPIGEPGRAPEIMEHGGVATIRLRKRDQRKYGRRYGKARIAARPFMRPALQTFADDPEFIDLWKDIVR